MIEYRATQRLHTLGGAQVIQRIPSASSDWWDIAGETCVAAYQAKGAASLAASYVNLANPGTYDLTTTSAPDWNTSTGWTKSAGGHLLNTGIVPDGNFSIIGRYAGLVGSGAGAWLMVSSTPGAVLGMYPNRTGTARGYRWGNGTSNTGSAVAAGVMAQCGPNGYHDGSLDVTLTGTFGTSSMGITIFSVDGNYFAVLAVAIYSTTLDAAQVASLSAAMAAL